MLRLQRFTSGMTHQSPTGLASGSQRLHYAWVMVAVASMSGWQNIGNGLGMALGPVLGGLIWTQTGDSTGVLVFSFGASLAGACYPFWFCPVPPATCSPPGRSSSRLSLARVRGGIETIDDGAYASKEIPCTAPDPYVILVLS
jgi:hypothetical protein